MMSSWNAFPQFLGKIPKYINEKMEAFYQRRFRLLPKIVKKILLPEKSLKSRSKSW